MKTEKDLIKLQENACAVGKGTPMGPYDSQYQYFLECLYDCYISKFDGIERIQYELEQWDEESQEIIIGDLIKLINREHVLDFDEQEFLQEIFERLGNFKFEGL